MTNLQQTFSNMVKNWKHFLNIRNKKRVLLPATIIQHSFRSPNHVNQRRNKRNPDWKRSKTATVCRWHDTLVCPFFDWVCFLYWAAWAACIFWKLILYQLSHLQIFSPILSCLFILFVVSFAVQKLLSLIRMHLFISVTLFHYFRRWVKKDLTVVYVKECSACVSL